MANYNGVLLSNELIVAERKKQVRNVKIVRNFSLLTLEREQNIYPVEIITLFPDDFEDGATKERNNFEAILTFGDNRIPPRRFPLEPSWTKKRN